MNALKNEVHTQRSLCQIQMSNLSQAADTGTAQWCGPSKHMTMESEQEESVALQASNSRLILQPALQLSSSCQLTGSITSEAGTAAAVDAAEVSQQQQPPPKKRRSTLLRPLKPFKPHHSNQADPRAQASDMSAVMKALQQPANLHSHEQKQPYLHPQEVTAASAEPAAAATESQCSQESFRASNAVHQATHAVTSHNSSANRGPCRTDLSKHLVVINQQLSSDHSSSTALVASSAQSSQLKQQQQQLDAAGQQPEQQQGGQEQVSRKRQRPSCLYGNYHHYYGYRIGPSGFEDPRMKVCPSCGARAVVQRSVEVKVLQDGAVIGSANDSNTSDAGAAVKLTSLLARFGLV